MSDVEQYLTEETKFVPAVVGFAVNQNSVLMGLRKKVSLDLGLNLISGIGGKVGDEEEYRNESVDEALVREFEEETKNKHGEKMIPVGFENVGRVRFIWTDKPQRNQDVTIFLIKSWIGIPQESEVVQPMWFNTESLLKTPNLNSDKEVQKIRSEILSGLPRTQMWEDNLDWVPYILAGLIVEAVFIYGKEGAMIAKTVTVYNKVLNQSLKVY